MQRRWRYATAWVALLLLGSCSPPSESGSPAPAVAEKALGPDRAGFILSTGGGEILNNGIVVKLSPAKGTEGSILVEQTFQRGGSTVLHRHEQGDELFYVVSGSGTATLSGATEPIGPGDVVFVPRNEVHSIQNLENADPLRVVFFMDSPELVQQFRAIHERVKSNPDSPPTPAEIAEIESRYGGGVTVHRAAN